MVSKLQANPLALGRFTWAIGSEQSKPKGRVNDQVLVLLTVDGGTNSRATKPRWQPRVTALREYFPCALWRHGLGLCCKQR
jgi:hypothetical protein